MRLPYIVGVIATAGSLALSPDLSLVRGSSEGDDGVGGSVRTLLEGPARSQCPNTHLLQEIYLRVSRALMGKGRPKSLAFAEMRKCRLLGRDPVRPGWVLDKDCFKRSLFCLE
jgi:hypothetical protein